MATNPNRRATRSEALDDLFITTLDNRRAGIVDVTFHKNPFFFWLSSKGKMDGRPGGREIVIDLEVGENDTVKSFGKGETFSLAEQEIFTEAHYPWKQIGGSLVRYATDDAKNAGRSAYIRMAETRVKNLEKSIRKELETQLMGDGTGNNSKDINGLQKLVNAAGTGYSADDILTLTEAGSSGDATVTVLTVGGGGEVLTVALTDVGYNYTTGSKATTLGGSNNDCTITISTVTDAELVVKASATVANDTQIQFNLTNVIAGDRFRVFIKGTVNSLIEEAWVYIDGEL